MVNDSPFLSQSEKAEIAKQIEAGKYSVLDLSNKLDSVKESLKDLSNSYKSKEVFDIENRTKLTNLDTKFTYFQSEFNTFYTKIDGKLETLTESKTEYRRDISILNEKVQGLSKELKDKFDLIEEEINEIKDTKKESKNTTIAIVAIIASIIAAVITGIIDKLL